MDWEFFEDEGRWESFSKQHDDGNPFRWVIKVCRDGKFDLNESDKELCDGVSTFDTFLAASSFCEGLENDPEPNILLPYQQRVTEEKNKVDENATKLSAFIKTNPKFKTYNITEQTRLRQQCLIMWELSKILGKRIAAFSAE